MLYSSPPNVRNVGGTGMSALDHAKAGLYQILPTRGEVAARRADGGGGPADAAL